MSTSYPAALDSYSVKVDGVTDVVASHVNNLQDAVVAIQTFLGAQGVNFARSNILINGGFDIWQRTTNDTGVTTTRKYVSDRWGVQTGAGTLANVQRSTTIRSGGRSKYSLEMVGATGVTTVNISQRIESALSALYKQTLYFTGYVYNGSGAAFTPKIYLSTPSAADNWTSSTVRNGSGSGENLQSCADAAWTKVSWSADVSGYTNIDNGLELRVEVPSGSLVASDTVRLAEFNLVIAVENPFINRPRGLELFLCQRYYEKSYDLETTPGSSVEGGAFEYVGLAGNCTVGDYLIARPPFKVAKRTTPTITIWDRVGNSGKFTLINNSTAATNNLTPTIDQPTENNFRIYGQATATDQRGVTVHWRADAEL